MRASLVTIYNMFDSAQGDVRFALFVALLEFCVAANQASQVASRLANVDALIATWKIAPVAARPLYMAAHKALTQVFLFDALCFATSARRHACTQIGSGGASLAMLVRYLQSFDASDVAGQVRTVVEPSACPC